MPVLWELLLGNRHIKSTEFWWTPCVGIWETDTSSLQFWWTACVGTVFGKPTHQVSNFFARVTVAVFGKPTHQVSNFVARVTVSVFGKPTHQVSTFLLESLCRYSCVGIRETDTSSLQLFC